jgi:hypothetical protein
VGGVRHGGSSVVLTSGNPGNPTLLDVRHQCGPEYTFSLEVEMWGLWLALDCDDDEAVTAGVLFCSDNHWALNALKESKHSFHSILAHLQARLRGLKGRVCFQWVPALCGLLGNTRTDEEARKAVNLGLDDGVQRGRVFFEVVMGLIWSQVKDRPLAMPAHCGCRVMVLSGAYRVLQEGRKSCLPNLGVVASYY